VVEPVVSEGCVSLGLFSPISELIAIAEADSWDLGLRRSWITCARLLPST
jgi:hypothetical protein